MAARRLFVLAFALVLVCPVSLAPSPAVAQDRSTWSLPADYSGVQGGNDWYYYSGGQGAYQPLAYDTTVAPWPDRVQPSWNGDARFLEIAGPPEAYIQTGEGADTAVGWKAPRSGSITVTGRMTATSTSETYGAWCGPECDDGITFSILHGTEAVADPVRILHGDPVDQGHTITASFDVVAGDFVYFTQERGRWQDADAARYDFSVEYAGAGGGTSTPPGLREISHGIVPIGQVGTTDWSLDGSTDLIKVWAHSYADIVSQWHSGDAIDLDQSWIKVLDYRIVEATGVTGALYDADLTLGGRLAGIVDRLDYTLPVGGSATKYRAQLVVGVAETDSYSSIDSAIGARAVVWDVHNNLWVDLAWDIGEAVVGAAIGELASAGVPSTWLAFALGRALDVNLSVLPIAYDLIGAAEETNGRFEATLENLKFQAGKKYVVYAYLSGAVSTASTGLAAGVCEFDFWHHSPYITDSAGSDAMGGRGFKLTDYSVSFHPTDYDPPAALTGPDPADGSLVDLSERKEGTFPLRGVTLDWADNRGTTYRWKWHVYFGDTFPLAYLGQTYDPTMWTQRFSKPNTTYYWKLVAEGYGGRITEGPLWSYHTNDFNRDPGVVQQWPEAGAVGQSRRPTLTWLSSDPNGQPMTYELFLGKTNPPTVVVSSGQVGNDGRVQVEPDTLDPDATYSWFVRLRDDRDGQSDSPVRSFTTANAAPQIVAPQPIDGASGIDANGALSVMVSDRDGDPVTVELYVGSSSGNLLLQGQVTEARTLSGYTVRFTVPNLARGQLVYWQVIADDAHGGRTTGPVWSFRTRPNSVPRAPSSLSPVNHATAVSLNPQLSWSSSDPDGDALTYDLYLGDQGVLNIPLVAPGLTSAAYNAGPLIANHTYNWKVVARDAFGGQSESAAMWFTTGAP